MLLGRDFVIPEDVKALAVPAVAHRISLRPEMWVRRITGAAAPVALGMGAFLQIGLDDLAQKVAGFAGCFYGVVLFGTHVPIIEAGALKIWRLRDIA